MNLLPSPSVPLFPSTRSPLISSPKILGAYSIKEQFYSVSYVICNNIYTKNSYQRPFYVVNETAYSLQVAKNKNHGE